MLSRVPSRIADGVARSRSRWRAISLCPATVRSTASVARHGPADTSGWRRVRLSRGPSVRAGCVETRWRDDGRATFILLPGRALSMAMGKRTDVVGGDLGVAELRIDKGVADADVAAQAAVAVGLGDVLDETDVSAEHELPVDPERCATHRIGSSSAAERAQAPRRARPGMRRGR